MNILNSVFWGCLGGLAVVLPYIIYADKSPQKALDSNRKANRGQDRCGHAR